MMLPAKPIAAASSAYTIRTSRALAPRHRRTATVSHRWRMKTTTALETPMPPRSRATSATRPRYRVRRVSASFRLFWSSATVRICTRSVRSDLRYRSARACGDFPAGKRRYASYSAREPKPSSLVSARCAAGMKILGPNAARKPVLPGALTTVPEIWNVVSPSERVSPTRAPRAVSNEGSTTVRRPACSSPHADAGSVTMWP